MVCSKQRKGLRRRAKLKRRNARQSCSLFSPASQVPAKLCACSISPKFVDVAIFGYYPRWFCWSEPSRLTIPMQCHARCLSSLLHKLLSLESATLATLNEPGLQHSQANPVFFIPSMQRRPCWVKLGAVKTGYKMLIINISKHHFSWYTALMGENWGTS
jgi:hypothetical protein